MTGNMQCFSYLQTVEKSFFEEENVEKCHFPYLYSRPLPYSLSRGGREAKGLKTLCDFEVFKATPLRNEKGVKIRGIYWYKV
jgi:hypothetical protein